MSSATLVVGSAGREQLERATLLLFRPCAALLAALGGTQGHCCHHRQLDPGLARCTGQRRPLSDIRGALGWTELGPAGSAVVVVSCMQRGCPPGGHVKYTAGVHVVALPPDASRHNYFASLPALKSAGLLQLHLAPLRAASCICNYGRARAPLMLCRCRCMMAGSARSRAAQGSGTLSPAYAAVGLTGAAAQGWAEGKTVVG